jgi:hypothetical protein
MIMVVKKVEGGYQVFSEAGKALSKVYASEEEAKKRLGQIEHFKKTKESEFSYVVPITECEPIVEKEGEKPTKVKVSGTCLVPTVSRNKNKYVLKNLAENDGKTVKFFMQEHGKLELNNVVGKVGLKHTGVSLVYEGVLRNTEKHPDVVDHALNKEIDVSIDARASSPRVENENGSKVYSWGSIDIRALCGVGIGGVAENTMDLAVAESFDGYEAEEQKDIEVKKVDESEQMKVIAEKDNEIESLKKRVQEMETEKLRVAEAEKAKVIASIKNLNKDIKGLEEKEISELKLIFEYEKKLKEAEEEEEKEEEKEGNGEVEGEPSGSTEENEIVVSEAEDSITMTNKGYEKFREDLNNELYI